MEEHLLGAGRIVGDELEDAGKVVAKSGGDETTVGLRTQAEGV